MAGSAPAPTTSPRADTIVVGRDFELRHIASALALAESGRGSLLIVAGAAGAGKTHLLQAAADEGARVGATVAWSRCSAEGDGPYELWFTVLDRVGAGSEILAEAALPPELTADQRPARPALFRTIAGRMKQATARRPALVLLDDLDRADPASLALLRHVVRELVDLSLVIVVSWREPAHHPRAPALDAIAAEGTRLALAPLQEGEVAALLEHACERTVPLALTRRVCAVTDGHPELIADIARQLARADRLTDATMTLPEPLTARASVAERVRRLGADEHAVAIAVAVSTRPLGAPELGELTGLPPDAADHAARTGVAGGLLESAPGGRYRFAHRVAAEVLLEQVPQEERTDLHERCARMLSDAARSASPLAESGSLPEIAHHLRRAVPRVPVAEAVEASLGAARTELRRLAYEDAATHAAEAIALGPAPPEEVTLRLIEGEARLAAGETEAARRTLRAAAERARELGDDESLTRAALAYGGGPPAWAAGPADPELLALLEEALATEPAPALRARLYGRLAEEHVARRDLAAAQAASQEASRLAREAGEDAAQLGALRAELLAGVAVDGGDERQAAIAQLRTVADRLRNDDARVQAATWAISASLERAQRSAANAAFAELEAVANASRASHHLWSASVAATMLALLDGRLADAEERLASARREGEGAVALAGAHHAAQLIALRREQGCLAELEPVIRATLSTQGVGLSWRLTWIAALCAQERDQQAREELARVPAAAARVAGGEVEWPSRLTLLAELAVRLDWRAPIETLRRELEPYAGTVVVPSLGILCRGAIDRYLGMLAGAAGDTRAAEEHFDAAQVLHAALVSPVWTARTETDRAQVRAVAGDHRGAGAAAARALEIADDLGLVEIAARARALSGAAASAPPRTPAEELLVFARDDDGWLVGAPAGPVHVRDARGMSYIARLLAAPGTEVFAGELAGSIVTGEQPVLDEQALDSFRQRVRELESELAAADRAGDPYRSARAQQELDALGAELRRSVGLRGRGRTLPGPTERARSSVTKAIRSAIRRIALHDAALADHLDGAIRTGTFCRYVPDPLHPVCWQVTM